MATNQFLSFFFVFLLFYIAPQFVNGIDQKQIYIVYMGALPRIEGQQTTITHYTTILEGVGVSKESMVRSYTKSFGGFAAYLTEMERRHLAAKSDVVSVFPSRTLQVLTTQSWDFIGFPVNVDRNPTIESDIIVGLLDTGIWPASQSFNDSGFSSPPIKWKGACKGGQNFTCNNKIIGARFYVEDSALDTMGHGSHTASTAAGNEVKNASFYGIANGIARGAVPSARIAVYKVCNVYGCQEHDILAAFDDAIADGVDILSVSLGSDQGAIAFQDDAIAIGGFHTMSKGILTVQAAGNSGSRGSTCSVAPWLFSVAASTTSRQIINKVQLGNGTKKSGYAIDSFDLNGKKFPLVYGIDASESGCAVEQTRSCDCLEKQKVKGKIVMCNSIVGIQSAFGANATGLLLRSPVTDVSQSPIVPMAATLLRPKDFELVEHYYNSTKNPEASIFKSETHENKTAPIVAPFSSRGPNQILPDILKPDITAPGVNILAAYTPVVSPFVDGVVKRSVPFNFLSGTSMACPHIAGAAAYIKSKHPNWSPSAIKSALMTTAMQMNDSQSGDGNGEFSYGSGFINPVMALNPGLVYETTKMDYVKMLCNLGYNSSSLGRIFGDNTSCSKKEVSVSVSVSTPRDLNYPTMSARMDTLSKFSVKFPRTVTNVGQAKSTYKATVSHNPQCNITVKPKVLHFKKLNEKQSFVVTITGKSSENMISASLNWSNGLNIVRSPIVLYK